MTFPCPVFATELGCAGDTKFGGNPHYHPFTRFHCLYDSARENTHENPTNTGGKHRSAPAEMEQSFIHSICSEIPTEPNPAPPGSCFSRRKNKMLITKGMLPTQNKSPPRVHSLTCLLKADLNEILKSLRKLYLHLLYYTNSKYPVCYFKYILHYIIFNS